MSSWKKALAARTDLNNYGDNAIGLFALALSLGVEDLNSVAADAITDGTDDKKCDLVYINDEDGYAVIAQCYFCKTAKASAPSNKASDLNTGVSWLLQVPLGNLPVAIKSAAEQLRDGLQSGKIKTLHIWYIHNLPESKNVKHELQTVEHTAKSAISTNFSGKNVSIEALEVGDGKFTEWYSDTQSPILVSEKFEIEITAGNEIKGVNWDAYVTAIPARFLYRQYRKYKTKLFSVNVRDYLGSRDSESNINNGIRRTVEEDPDNFWAFNNGLTILVNNYETIEKGKKKILQLQGLSIVNGAQTTGAIGTLKKLPPQTSMVQARFIKTIDLEIIQKIIQFNNSQNQITASDFRSTDKIQKRLKLEVSKITNADYEGGRRGGYSNAIIRRPNLLPSYTVGQALTAFHGDTVSAYNSKKRIWVDDKLYGKIFNDQTKGKHLVFVYGLLRAIENRKKFLVSKSKKSSLTEIEDNQLAFFRKRGSIFLFLSAISGCLETYLERQIVNKFRLSFGAKSPKKAEEIWSKIVEVNAPLCIQLDPAFSNGLKSQVKINQAIQAFKALVAATANANVIIYKEFKKNIVSLQ